MKKRTIVCDKDNKVIGIFEDGPKWEKELKDFLKGKKELQRYEKEVDGLRRIKIIVKEK